MGEDMKTGSRNDLSTHFAFPQLMIEDKMQQAAQNKSYIYIKRKISAFSGVVCLCAAAAAAGSGLISKSH